MGAAAAVLLMVVVCGAAMAIMSEVYEVMPRTNMTLASKEESARLCKVRLGTVGVQVPAVLHKMLANAVKEAKNQDQHQKKAEAAARREEQRATQIQAIARRQAARKLAIARRQRLCAGG